MMHNLFVYGSLMRGEYNHRVMVGARFVRKARTAMGFDLHDLGSFPAMVARGTGQVTGEVYEVDDVLLKRLDVFEGVPTLYERRAVTLDDGSKVGAYLMQRARMGRAQRIKNGNWKSRRKGTGR